MTKSPKRERGCSSGGIDCRSGLATSRDAFAAQIRFRPWPLHAERIRPYVEPTFSAADVSGLPNFPIVGRLLVDDAPGAPFLFTTAWRATTIDDGRVATLRSAAQEQHGGPA
jgi:hypothetical protein